MARFDYYAGTKNSGYLLDCQSDFLSEFESRIVVPLLSSNGLMAASRLNPIFEIAGEQYIMSTQLIFAIPLNRLGNSKGSLMQQHYAIINALNALIGSY